MSQVLRTYLTEELDFSDTTGEGNTLRGVMRQPLFDAIKTVIESYGTESYTAEEQTPEAAQARFILQLSDAITERVSDAVSKVIADEVSAAVQTYLTTNVTTNLGLIVVPSPVGIPHTHVVPPLPLNAP